MRDDKRSSATVPLLIVVGVSLLPVLYVLSIGPAWWLFSHDLVDSSIYTPYVTPAWRLAEATWTDPQLDAYLDLWADGPPTGIHTPGSIPTP